MTNTTLDTGTPDLLATLEAGVLTLTLNRPEARNAMSRAMNQALAEQLADSDPARIVEVISYWMQEDSAGPGSNRFS